MSNKNKTSKTDKKYISVAEFAKRKEVHRSTVNYRLLNGDISYITIGENRAIDWEANKHVEFPNAIRFNKKPTDGTEENKVAEV